MIRTVLAVALAVAVVGVAVPVVEEGRVRAADRAVDGELAAVERAAESLLAADETTPSAGARRTVALSLPSGSWRAADVDAFRIHGAGPGRRGSVTYRIDGGRRTVAVDAPLYTPSGPVVVGDGTVRVVLSLDDVDGRRVVVVRLAGGDDPSVYHRSRDQPGS